jgi:hypothetical protein
MKKLLAVIVGLVLAAALGACGLQAETASPTVESTVASGETLTESTTAPNTGALTAATETALTVESTTAPPESVPESRSKAVTTPAPSKSSTTTTRKSVTTAKPVTTTRAAVTTTKTTTTAAQTTAAAFDINYWVQYAKDYALSIGMTLDETATACWDTPITAYPNSDAIIREVKSTITWYQRSGYTSIWAWSEKLSNGKYNLYIGYS